MSALFITKHSLKQIRIPNRQKERRKSVRRKAGSHELKRSRTRENNVLKEVEEGMRLLDEEEGV